MLSLERCPGSRELIGPTQIVRRTCPYCSDEVEFFSDEAEAKCQKCGHKLHREATPSCVSWCQYAEKCIDDLRNRRLIPPSRAEELIHMAKKKERYKSKGR